MFTYVINQNGINEVANFVKHNHKLASDLDNDCIMAWAIEAEDDKNNSGVGMIEIRGFDSVSGNPITLIVDDCGFNKEEIEE